MTARHEHACCTVRGALVVLGGYINTAMRGVKEMTSTVEILSVGAVGFTSLPSLSCGGIAGAFAIAVEESNSAAGQVLLIGGHDGWGGMLSMVDLVDLATGTCTPQPATIYRRAHFTAVRIPDGRVVCGGGNPDWIVTNSAEVWGSPEGEGPSAVWTELPAMSVGRMRCCGCVMSDGRFAVLGGNTNKGGAGSVHSSFEVLNLGEHAYWTLLAPMHHERFDFACAAVARCIIVAGGSSQKSEVYDEDCGRWLQLPCNCPDDVRLDDMGSALM
jgi:hypothetical protein